MSNYWVHFSENESFIVEANDIEEAQEKAIDIHERFGIVSSEIVAIVRTSDEIKAAQFVGNEPTEGFACYINVSL